MLDELNDYNWKEAFKYVGEAITEIAEQSLNKQRVGFPITIEDVTKVIYKRNGHNDEDNWWGIFKIKIANKFKYLYLTAWCDYSGWG